MFCRTAASRDIITFWLGDGGACLPHLFAAMPLTPAPALPAARVPRVAWITMTPTIPTHRLQYPYSVTVWFISVHSCQPTTAATVFPTPQRPTPRTHAPHRHTPTPRTCHLPPPPPLPPTPPHYHRRWVPRCLATFVPRTTYNQPYMAVIPRKGDCICCWMVGCGRWVGTALLGDWSGGHDSTNGAKRRNFCLYT